MNDQPKTLDLNPATGEVTSVENPPAVQQQAAAPILSRDAIRSIGVEEAIKALKDYQAVQDAFDQAMPNSRMKIGDKEFRKKEYWRAVKRAFLASTESIGEWMIVQYEDGSAATLPFQGANTMVLPAGSAPVKDYTVRSVVRCSHPSGAIQDGVGYCSRSEKLVYQKEWYQYKGRNQWKYLVDEDGEPLVDKAKTLDSATMHNVAAHAYTRAVNRSISDLVGFGEVSAEEIHPRAEASNGAGGAESDRKEKATTRRAPSPAPANKATGKDTPPAFLPGDPICGTCAGVQPETAWKPSKLAKGTKDKSFRMAEFPGVLFRTNSNPLDPKHPWGDGDALTCEAGAKYPKGQEDDPEAVASLDAWFYDKTGDWYVRVDHVRPAATPASPAEAAEGLFDGKLPSAPETPAAASPEPAKASDTTGPSMAVAWDVLQRAKRIGPEVAEQLLNSAGIHMDAAKSKTLAGLKGYCQEPSKWAAFIAAARKFLAAEEPPPTAEDVHKRMDELEM